MTKQFNYLFSIVITCWFIVLCVTQLSVGCTDKTEHFSVLFTGDMMFDRGIRTAIGKHGVDYLFNDVANDLRQSDFCIANFEGTACDSTLMPENKLFTFRSNPEWLKQIRQNGITHVTLANNHSFDYGEAGAKQTVSNLIGSKIIPFGYKNTENEPSIIEKNGTRVALFSTCWLNQNNNFACTDNTTTLAQKIKRLRKIHPNFLIFVVLHWGLEMRLMPTQNQVTQAHNLLDAGADAIIGHHPHVVQTIEKYKGKYVFYSLGNFIFDNNTKPANEGAMARLLVSGGRIESVQLIPFTIAKSKPTPMSAEQAHEFFTNIQRISQTVEITQMKDGWKVL